MNQSSPSKPNTAELLQCLADRCQLNHSRALVVFAGEREWGETAVATALSEIGLPQLDPNTNPRVIRDLAGKTLPAGLLNAWQGFNLDSIAILSGCITGGGLLYMICPPLDTWPAFDDPEYERLLAWPGDRSKVHGRFLRRFATLIETTDALLMVNQNTPEAVLRLPATAPYTPTTVGVYASSDQRKAVEKILGLAQSHSDRLLILDADRGRGKSASLGLAAKAITERADLSIAITGPSPRAVETALHHVGGDSDRFRFFPVDVLIEKDHPADLLMIDEAAGVPVPVLRKLIVQYPRAVLAGTRHGYEGTGQGFRLRLEQALQQQALDWQTITLDQPIRYAPDDPLEKLVNAALMLNAEPDATLEKQCLDCRRIERDQLLHNEALLGQLYGLLLQSHYQTTPDDLRHLLDAPNFALFTIGSEHAPTGAALIAQEGPLPAGLCEEITAGKRRPRGHLTNQTLLFHLGIGEAGALKIWRIVRIAIHPDLQRGGLGTRLLEFVEQAANDAGVDALSTSFGLNAELLHFWTRASLSPVRVGYRRNAASSYHSGLLFTPLSAAASPVADAARRHFSRQLPLQLSDHLRSIDPALAHALIEHGEFSANQNDLQDAAGFAHDNRNPADCIAGLKRVVCAAIASKNMNLSRQEAELLLAWCVQYRPTNSLCNAFSLTGEADLMNRCRQIVSQILSATNAKRQAK